MTRATWSAREALWGAMIALAAALASQAANADGILSWTGYAVGATSGNTGAQTADSGGADSGTLLDSINGLPSAGNGINAITIPTSDIEASGTTTTSSKTVTNISGLSSVVLYGAGYNQGFQPAEIVQGSLAKYYAAPVYAGSATWTQPYFSTGLGTITLNFSTGQSYLGFLWGSIASGDEIQFWSGANDTGTLLLQVTGAEAEAAAGATYNGYNGAQGAGGSQYTMINLSGTQFLSVELLDPSGVPSFESADYQSAATNQASLTYDNVPEPASIALFGAGLAGLCVVRRRTSRPA